MSPLLVANTYDTSSHMFVIIFPSSCVTEILLQGKVASEIMELHSVTLVYHKMPHDWIKSNIRSGVFKRKYLATENSHYSKSQSFRFITKSNY
jgi:hypothetical protein